jgi:PiT family inorganic phosphate transporter
MVAAWALTLPAAGLVAAGAALLTDQGTWGVTTVAVLGLAICAVIRTAARRKPITHANVNDEPGAEPQGAVTAAIAAVIPPPAGSGPVTPAGPAAPSTATA